MQDDVSNNVASVMFPPLGRTNARGPNASNEMPVTVSIVIDCETHKNSAVNTSGNRFIPWLFRYLPSLPAMSQSLARYIW